MGKADFLTQLDSDRLRLLAAFAGLSPDEMTATKAVGEWTVNRILTQTALPHYHLARRRA